MQTQSIFTFLLLFIFTSAQAQVTITGTSEMPDSLEISFVLFDDYLKKEGNAQKVTLENGVFSITADVTEPRLAHLTVGESQIPLYLTAGDQLSVALKVDNMVEFSGDGAANNQFYHAFHTEFGDHFDLKKAEEAILAASTIDVLEMDLFAQKKKHWDFYKNYEQKAELSKDFSKFIEKSINYNYTQHIVSFPIVRANNSKLTLVSRLPSVIQNEIDKDKINDPDAMMIPAYRNLVYYFTTYFTSEKNNFNKFSDFSESLTMKETTAKEYLDDEAYSYVMASYLLAQGEQASVSVVKKLFTELELTDKSGKYSTPVQAKLEDILNQEVVIESKGRKSEATGAADDGLGLVGLDGEAISLNDFKGKVVYIDFWASWCGPCRKQFPFAKELKESLSKKEKKKIAFLYISIDDSDAAWKKSIEKMGIEGDHALSPGGWKSKVTKYFQINSIPRYMIMDPNGKIVDLNAKRPSQKEVLDDIKKYMK